MSEVAEVQQPEKEFSMEEAQKSFMAGVEKNTSTNENVGSKEKANVEKNVEGSRLLTEAEQQKFKDLANDEDQLEKTREVLKWGGLRPVAMAEIEDQNYYLSRVLKGASGDRDQIMMYYEDQNSGKFLPRALYKSKSDGGWRSAPGSNGEQYSKGKGYHYTQETKPHEKLITSIELVEKSLETIDANGLDLNLRYFDYTEVPDVKPDWLTFGKEVHKIDDRGALQQFQKFPPGNYTFDRFQGTDFSAEFRDFDFNRPELQGFLPDFQQEPERTLETTHTLLGQIKLESYPAKLNGRDIEWVMAQDQVGRVWVERIAFKDSPINSYGVRSEVIDSGALTNKPLEYGFQISALKVGEFLKRDDSYCDITPLLDNLRPIREFRAAKGVETERIPKEEEPTIDSAKNFDDLRESLIKVGGLEGSSRYYTSDELLTLVDQVRRGERGLTHLTRTNGLRESVARLLEEDEKAA